ncbi:RNA-binding domain-containing protein [Linderina pennispora]|uniref:RNA-binding domain-containing protein n=1 Tax=Linderina pennispora TaxID=61395 RepID=A0A1Y1VWF1_9FUNG|nr:RNA-binding domain-containing protein [Linderina pennispora]ORX65617.1 RNA-binding domain-containing protein [Linderina pennispora]
MSQEINVEELLDAPFKRETEVNAKLNASSPTATKTRPRTGTWIPGVFAVAAPAVAIGVAAVAVAARVVGRAAGRAAGRAVDATEADTTATMTTTSAVRQQITGDDDDDRYYRRSSRYSDDRSEYRRPSSRRQSTVAIAVEWAPAQSNATRSPSPAVDDADRDLRTVFAMQLSANLTRRDLMEFFAKAGRVRDAHIVSDKGSRRSRGVAYVEFYSIESAMKAVELSNERLLGVPIIVQPSEAEKNRQASLKQYSAAGVPMNRTTPINSMIHVDGLVVNMESSDLRMIFEQFGPVVHCRVMQARDAKGDVIENEWAAAVNLRVRMATKTELEREETLARSEVSKLVAGSGISPATVPAARSTAPGTPAETESAIRSVAVLLTNMFDPAEETEPTWVEDLSDDVRDECVKYGRVERVFVDRESCGNIYLKFADEEAAELARKAMNHRWFGGRQVVAQFIPVERFEDAVSLPSLYRSTGAGTAGIFQRVLFLFSFRFFISQSRIPFFIHYIHIAMSTTQSLNSSGSRVCGTESVEPATVATPQIFKDADTETQPLLGGTRNKSGGYSTALSREFTVGPNQQRLRGERERARVRGRRHWLVRGYVFVPQAVRSIAYVDPGNVCSDLHCGAVAGYKLIWLLFLTHALGLYIQTLSARIGTVTGKNLAQHCRMRFGVGRDPAGCCAELCDSGDPEIRRAQGRGSVCGMIAVMCGCFGFEVFLAKPDIRQDRHRAFWSQRIAQCNVQAVGIGGRGESAA